MHAFTDGRDVSPHAAASDLATLPAERIATIVGRYYAMDRDGRWERTDRALDAICDGIGEIARQPVAAIEASYARGVTDEFIEPIVLDGRPRLDPARDTAIFFNFRPDRGRQLSHRLPSAAVDLTTMTRYADDLDCPVAFDEQIVRDTLAEMLSGAGRAAARRRDREVRARHLLLQRRRGGRVAGRDADPGALTAGGAELRRAAGDVRARGRGALRGRDRRRLPLRGDQLRQSRHGRAYGRRFPPSSRRSRSPTRVSARSSTRRTAPAACVS